jgi:hypothetical protein
VSGLLLATARIALAGPRLTVSGSVGIGFSPDVRWSQTAVTLVVADLRERVRIEIGIENDFQLHIRPP